MAPDGEKEGKEIRVDIRDPNKANEKINQIITILSDVPFVEALGLLRLAEDAMFSIMKEKEGSGT